MITADLLIIAGTVIYAISAAFGSLDDWVVLTDTGLTILDVFCILAYFRLILVIVKYFNGSASSLRTEMEREKKSSLKALKRTLSAGSKPVRLRK